MDIQHKILQDIQEVSNYKKADVVPFSQREDVRKAEQDFRYLSTQQQCHVAANLGLLTVTRHGNKLGDVLPVPMEKVKKTTSIPKDKIKLNDASMYVAVVCYINGHAVDVFLLNSKMFAAADTSGASGGFSKFMKKVGKVFKPSGLISFNEKTNEFVLKIKNEGIIKKYGFGVVFG